MKRERNSIPGLNILILNISMILISYKCFSTNNPVEDQLSMWTPNQICFQENKGQYVGGDGLPVPNVLFKAEAPNLNIWVTTKGLTYQFFKYESKILKQADGSFQLNAARTPIKEKLIHWSRVDMALKGANIKKENIIKEGDVTAGNTRYFLGHCPSGISNIKTYTKIIIKEIYPGIDWILYTSKTGELKHDFVVHPGANPNQIRLIYEGAGDINIFKNELHFKNKLGEIKEGQLLCYQGDTSKIIPSTYKFLTNSIPTYMGTSNSTLSKYNKQKIMEVDSGFSYEINISLSKYDETQELIIDPQLVWGTLYGGNQLDGFKSLDTDDLGNVFVTGYTSSVNFPVLDTGTFYQGIFLGGNTDIVILKFNTDGALQWSTFYGGNDIEHGSSIIVDAGNNIWITGFTKSTNFPTTSGALQSLNAGKNDVFLAKFDNNGNPLYSTYYGGDGNDEATSITIDPTGSVWITGFTDSTNFPTTLGAFQTTNNGAIDVFISKFDNMGGQLFSSLYGSSGNDQGNRIAANITGDIWVTGFTDSTDFPITASAFQTTNAGGIDGFIIKFDNLGAQLWASYAGGSGDDEGNSIQTDPNGNVWVVGMSGSIDFPIPTATAIQPAFGGGVTGNFGIYGDLFILKLDNMGNQLYASYFGGNGNEGWTFSDRRTDMVIDNCGNVYISFETTSTDLITLNPGNCSYYKGTHWGPGAFFNRNDCFISKFDNNANLLWASYIGGNNNDFRTPLAIDNNNNLFMGGEFTNYFLFAVSTLPLLDAGSGSYFDNVGKSGDDAFLLKFVPNPINTIQSKVDPTSCTPCNGSITAEVISSCKIPPYSYVWSNGQQTLNTTNSTDTISGLCSGNYSVIVTSNCNQSDTLYYNLAGNFLMDSVIIFDTICQGDSILFNGVYQDTEGIYYTLISGGNSFGCDSIITLSLKVIPMDSIGFFFATDTFCLSDPDPTPSVLSSKNGLFAINNNGFINSTSGKIDITSSGIGTFTISYAASNGSCAFSNYINIISCESIFNSNVFSPNGDGVNDVFFIRGNEVENIDMKIFDRWGNVVFESRDILNGWDGKTKKGILSNQGVYAYVVYGNYLSGENINLKGNITLIR